MIITRKAISRRTMLRGMGAAVALPLLDAMIPAMSAPAQTPARPVKRFGAIYVPNGIIPSRWFPAREGVGFEFSSSLKPLEAFRDQLLVLNGLDSAPTPPPGSPTAVHARASTKFLTNVHPSRAILAGASMDQLVAKNIGKDTTLPSIELALEPVDLGAVCDDGSCIYTGTISWAGPTAPLPMETDPSAVFERLFGDDTTDPARRRERNRQQGSLLDSVLGEISSLEQKVGPSDRVRLSGYLENLRAVEDRIQKAAAQNVELPAVTRPSGIPTSFADHAKLMFDLQVLAYQADVTRVFTYMIGREFSGRTYPEIGVPDAHHPISHHRNEEERMDRCARINEYHASLFSYFLEKLASTPEGDGTLLDHVLLMYGAGMGEGNTHTIENVPIILAGAGTGTIKGGRHVKYAKGTPLANLHVALMNRLDTPVDSFGNSTGVLDLG